MYGHENIRNSYQKLEPILLSLDYMLAHVAEGIHYSSSFSDDRSISTISGNDINTSTDVENGEYDYTFLVLTF